MNLTEAPKKPETLTKSDSPLATFQKQSKKIVELLTNVSVIKVIAADLIDSYERQFETTACRKVESLQSLKNRLNSDLCGFRFFDHDTDEIFDQVLDEINDIIKLAQSKRNGIARTYGFICKVKNSVLSANQLSKDQTDNSLTEFKSLVASLYESLMSRNFVRSLVAEMVEERKPTSAEEARKLYENILDNLKWITLELNIYPFKSVEKLSYDLLKRQVPKFEITEPKQTISQTLSQELQSKPDVKRKSPFANKISLETHFRAHHIAGVPEGLNEVILPVAAAYCIEYASLTRQLGITPERGLILFGPPGTGKTVMAQAIAGYLGCPDEKITITSGSNLLDKWVGSTEASIRNLFNPARKDSTNLHVIIIDEIDAILSTRQHAKNSWEKTQVTQFLTELDGIRSPRNIFVIGITNFVEHLDRAATRPGRLGSLIEVPLPNSQQRIQIFELHLSFIDQSRLATTCENLAIELAQLTEGFSGADIRAAVQRTANLVFMETVRAGHFKDDAAVEEFGRPITILDFVAVIEFIYKQKKQQKTPVYID